MSPILDAMRTYLAPADAMRTYLAPALFNSKENELKRHVPKMQTSNQFFILSTNVLLFIISRLM